MWRALHPPEKRLGSRRRVVVAGEEKESIWRKLFTGRSALALCLLIVATVVVYEMWRRSSIPPRWEDRLKGGWTGHSAAQTLALTRDGGVVAGGFAPSPLAPAARVVCYDATTGARRWQWRSSHEIGSEGGNRVGVAAEGDAIVVTIGTIDTGKERLLESVRLDVATGRPVSSGSSGGENVRSAGVFDELRSKMLVADVIARPNVLHQLTVGRYTIYSVSTERERSRLTRLLERLLGGVPKKWRAEDELRIQRNKDASDEIAWQWRSGPELIVDPVGVRLSPEINGRVAVALPRKGVTSSSREYEVIYLSVADGRQLTLPGSPIRAARLPSGVVPLALVATEKGRLIVAGRNVEATGDGWWVGGW
jgi:hypothetical protein